MKDVINNALKLEDELIAIRRDLHKIPELGGNLPLTFNYVCSKLDSYGIKYRKNQNDHGIIADIVGEKSGKTIALRADMDGLETTEETNVPFKSIMQGKMHACGHDVHTATLLIVAKVLNENRKNLKGTVRLLFQTGEETSTGAKEMISSGALDGVSEIYALHVGNLAGNNLNPGDISIISGPVSAGKNKFTITVNGVATHSAFPERGVDPILISARIVNGLEELTAREIPAGTPAVISLGSLNAGENHNTIPKKAVIKGSIRCQDPTVREFLGERVKQVAENISRAYRGSCDFELIKGSHTIVNDESLAESAVNAIKGVLDSGVVTKTSLPLMGSDDFSLYAVKVKSLYFFLNTNNIEKGITEPNHSTFFSVDESVLIRGVIAYLAICFNS
ncbi:MAG: amidohydrolase [Clostridia bacterium]|nr:amidohydrolase [Clostridia bacterium]